MRRSTNRLAHLIDNGMPDAVVTARLEKALLELTAGSGSRYDTTRDHVAALMRFHSWGSTGVPKALAQLFSAYVMEVADTRPRRVAEAEFRRFTEGAALLVAATPPSDPWCAMGMYPSTENGGSPVTDDAGAQQNASWGRVKLTDLASGQPGVVGPHAFPADRRCLPALSGHGPQHSW